jgi:soluble lytic murein transglycosylase
MQLLPSVGKAMAREEGISHFQTFQLLDPATNIRLGTRYLRQMLDSSAACRSTRWPPTTRATSAWSTGRLPAPIQGIDEFVESIPFTQTREYVEAILRNEETYKAIDDFAAPHGGRPRRRRGRGLNAGLSRGGNPI